MYAGGEQVSRSVRTLKPKSSHNAVAARRAATADCVQHLELPAPTPHADSSPHHKAHIARGKAGCKRHAGPANVLVASCALLAQACLQLFRLHELASLTGRKKHLRVRILGRPADKRVDTHSSPPIRIPRRASRGKGIPRIASREIQASGERKEGTKKKQRKGDAGNRNQPTGVVPYHESQNGGVDVSGCPGSSPSVACPPEATAAFRTPLSTGCRISRPSTGPLRLCLTLDLPGSSLCLYSRSRFLFSAGDVRSRRMFTLSGVRNRALWFAIMSARQLNYARAADRRSEARPAEVVQTQKSQQIKGEILNVLWLASGFYGGDFSWALLAFTPAKRLVCRV